MDLKVLVLDDGGVTVAAISNQLGSEGVPFDRLSLTDSARPAITSAFLSDTVAGIPRAKYQAIVMPNSQTTALTTAEHAAVDSVQAAFGIRVVSGYNWANPGIGLDYATYTGSVDGVTAALSPSAIAGEWKYLRGPVHFEDNDTKVTESYAYLAPVLATPAAGTSFTPVLTATVGAKTGVLAGVFNQGGREDLVLTFAYNQYQRQFQTIAHGIVTWMTKGIHLGYARNYYSVHVDDVLSPDTRWNVTANCTPEEDCPTGAAYDTPDILMTSSDVAQLVQWQKSKGFKLHLAFNAAPSVERVADNGSDPLTTAFVANRSAFQWINHTYTHEYLGCVRDYTTLPWRCQTDAAGNIVWLSRAAIAADIKSNSDWARAKGISLTATELVTGEHSGLKILPQMPTDNPNFPLALKDRGVKFVASDASRESDTRAVGTAAQTLPRYPMNVYFNTATEAEMTDEYNWIYTSQAAGGSGICSQSASSTCLDAPLSTTSGYRGFIVGQEVKIELGHVLSNDPRPLYAHQSNLTEGRIIYPVLDGLIDTYRADFATNTPLVDPSMAAATEQMTNRNTWNANRGVTAYVIDGTVRVDAPAGTKVPMTMPNGTRSGTSTWGGAYAGERSLWQNIPLAGTFSVTLPAGAYAAPVAAPVAAAADTTAIDPAQPESLKVPAATATASETPIAIPVTE